MSYNWGIDLGGTKIEGVILKAGSEIEVLERMRVPTEGDKGYQQILKNIKKLVDQLSQKSGLIPTRIGIGTPGALDPDLGTMKNSNSTALNNQPLYHDLEALLGVEIRMSNDANCFAVAETNLGIVKEIIPNAKVVFGIIMGTGVGGGVVIDGKVINGRHGIGGEWGHNFLHESGGSCYCGKSGCVETILSGTGLEKYYFSQAGKHKKLKNIVEDYRSGNDIHARKTMERLFHFFGKGVSSIINMLDPDVIVIGGGVGNINELYTLGKQEVEKHVFNHRMDTLILKPKLGDSAGVFGAALL